MPEWRDPAKFGKAQKQMTQHLLKDGWSQEQIDSIADHRLVVALYNDMRYRKATSGAPAAKLGQARRSGIRTAAPGAAGSAPRPKTEKDRQTDTFKRLSETGKTADAARYFETLL